MCTWTQVILQRFENLIPEDQASAVDGVRVNESGHIYKLSTSNKKHTSTNASLTTVQGEEVLWNYVTVVLSEEWRLLSGAFKIPTSYEKDNSANLTTLRSRDMDQTDKRLE